MKYKNFVPLSTKSKKIWKLYSEPAFSCEHWRHGILISLKIKFIIGTHAPSWEEDYKLSLDYQIGQVGRTSWRSQLNSFDCGIETCKPMQHWEASSQKSSPRKPFGLLLIGWNMTSHRIWRSTNTKWDTLRSGIVPPSLITFGRWEGKKKTTRQKEKYFDDQGLFMQIALGHSSRDVHFLQFPRPEIMYHFVFLNGHTSYFICVTLAHR